MTAVNAPYVELHAVDRHKASEYFTAPFGFSETGVSETPERDSILLRQGDFHLVVTSGPATESFKEHCDGIADIALGCDDVAATAAGERALPTELVAAVVTGSTGLPAAELATIKSTVTVNTSPLSQAAVSGVLLASNGRLSQANAEAAAHYGTGGRSVLRELTEVFSPAERERLGVRWNEPSGGSFLTMNVAFPGDNAALARCARDFGPLWTPMSHFYPNGGGEHALRLSFSYLTPQEIAEGGRRLARSIDAETSRHTETAS
ncbi:hypothetical protein [Streptomyces vastus]|uniref:VOC domain-containing protein n=1 Tax=Streptomyces vastus TaxID=285451 RepID=A0ABN3R3D5_9ACTN